MKISEEYANEHVKEILDVAVTEEVEIHRPSKPSVYITLNKAGDAWKLSNNRRQPQS